MLATIDDAVEQTIRNNTNIDNTEKEALIKARRGQGRFRQNLGEIEHKCRVTGVSDRRLLRASHIKPWRDCASNHERLDGYNGLLLAPHVDFLFDRGYLSFSDNGDILVSPRLDNHQLGLLGINTSLNAGPFLVEQRRYLGFHRQNVFLQ